jgi:hypothetical protein
MKCAANFSGAPEFAWRWRRTVTIAFRVTETSKQVLIVGVFYRGRDVAAGLKERR